MYKTVDVAETDDVTPFRDVVMTTGDDVMIAKCDVISVDCLTRDVVAAAVLLALLLLLRSLVTLVTLNIVGVVLATADDVE